MSRLAPRLLRLLRDPLKLPLAVLHRLAPLARHLGDGSRASWPRELIVYVNSSCNAHCQMCDIGAGRGSSFSAQLAPDGKPTLSRATFARLLADVQRFRPEINFNGVEPLLHPEITELVAMAHAARLPTKLVTNGILLSHHAAALLDGGLDRLVVSLDGREEVHDAIRGEGSYRHAIEGVREVLQRRRRDRRLSLWLNCCISAPNVEGLADFVREMLGTVGVDGVRIAHLNFVTGEMSEEHNRMHPSLALATPQSLGAEAVDVHSLWRELQSIRRRERRSRVAHSCELRSLEQLRAFYREPRVALGRGRCVTPWTSATITARGDVIIRNRCLAYCAGNIDERPFGEVWRGERYRAFRRALARARLFPICPRCCGAF